MQSLAVDAQTTWLLSDEAANWLEAASDTSIAIHQRAARLRWHLSPERARAVLELAELRARAARKFPDARRMFFHRIGLEQATDFWIAQYKAQRFARHRHVGDLCCGIGGDALGLASGDGRLQLADRCPTAVAFAARNVRECRGDGVANRLSELVADVESCPLEGFDAWHIDPDRRSSGQRTTQAALHEPSNEVIDRLLLRNPNAAVKLAPGCEPPGRWALQSELEWISRGGECRQLVAWQGALAGRPGERRATLLAARGEATQVMRTMVGTADLLVEPTDRIDRFVFEPDAAILASQLTGTLAAQHGWAAFAATSGYLTGPAAVTDRACTGYEVQEVLPLRVKVLSGYLRERRMGRLEIKHRAVPLSPERLRGELKLTGDRQATLLVTRIGERRIAIVCRRLNVDADYED